MTAARIRLGMVGGGQGAFIGEVHRIAARLDNHYELVAGALSSDASRAAASAEELGIAVNRSYANYAEMAKKEDRSNAVMLEMLGDLPSAEMKPPENVLFVCKLNPVTDDDDLTLIFSRFDQNAKAEIIRDQETGDSLQYAFVEFDTEAACNEAYFKMNNALIDDRRIKVDFSQSVAKEWNR